MNQFDPGLGDEGGAPAELRRIERALRELAAVEAGGAPAALEDRLFLRTRRELAAGRVGEMVVVRKLRWRSRVRAAAAVAFLSAIGAAMLAQRGPSGGGGASPSVAKAGTNLNVARLEEDVDLWLSFRTPETLQGLSDSIDMLSVDTTLLRTTLESDLADPGVM